MPTGVARRSPASWATQRFGLDLLLGRKFSAICARIGFVIMLHNAMSVLHHEYPGPWEDENRRLGD